MDLGLERRSALVTGGSSGIGLATVERLLDEGVSVVTCARDADRLDAALNPLAERHAGRLRWISANVRDRAEMERAARLTVDSFGGLDLVVGNAGQSLVSTFANTDDDDWRNELELKFFGTINTVRSALPYLSDSPSAAIVFVNAVLARQPEPHLVATGAARAGLLNLSHSLSREFGALSIRVNTVSVGVIDSGQWRRRFDRASTSESFEEWSAKIAHDRGTTIPRFGKTAEVAAAIAFLLSPMSGYTTGAVLDVAGGVGRYV